LFMTGRVDVGVSLHESCKECGVPRRITPVENYIEE